MQISLKSCEDFLRETIILSESVDPENTDHLRYLITDIALSGWILQRRSKNSVIDKNMLIQLTGSALQPHIETILRAILWKYLESDPRADHLHFSNEMMQAIENVFNDENLDYRISYALPSFDATILDRKQGQILGYEFLEYINCLSEVDHTALSFLVASAFGKNLIDVDVLIPYPDIYPEISLVRSTTAGWQFLVYVYPQLGTLEKYSINESIVKISHISALLQESNQSYGRIHSILIGADVNSEEALQPIKKYPNIHYLWSVSSIRFFHMLEQVKQKSQQEKLVEKFTKIFPDSGAGRLWARQAINRLRKGVGLSNYLIRLTKSQDKSFNFTSTYEIALLNGRDGIKLDLDRGDLIEHNKVAKQILITVDNEYHECTVLELDKREDLGENYIWVTTDRLEQVGLSINERKIVVKALAKYTR